MIMPFYDVNTNSLQSDFSVSFAERSQWTSLR